MTHCGGLSAYNVAAERLNAAETRAIVNIPIKGFAYGPAQDAEGNFDPEIAALNLQWELGELEIRLGLGSFCGRQIETHQAESMTGCRCPAAFSHPLPQQGPSQPSAEGAARAAAVAEGAEAGAEGATERAVEGAEGGVVDPQRPQVSSNRLTEEATIERAAVEETPAEGEAIEETTDEGGTAAKGGAAANEAQTVQ